MKRLTLAFAITTAVIFTASISIAAQGKGHGGGPKPKLSKAAHPPKVHTQGSGKVKTTGAGKAAGVPKAHGPNKVSGQGKIKAHDGSKKGPKSHVGTSGPALTPVQQKLQKNTNLADKLSGRVPSGTDLMLASDGFRNLGQFVAAVNVSNNLGIPFADLKARMVNDGLSLGQAIKAERSDVDFVRESRRAENDAAFLIRTTEAQTAKKPKKH